MPQSASPVRLRMLATSDVHMHLTGFDYRHDAPTAQVGLARLAALVRAARAGGPCVLLDNGDLLQGTVLGTLAAEGENPMPAILAEMGYDAMGLGNHDMDFGLPAFARFACAAPMPIVCSNFALEGTVPTALVEREVAGRPLRVGIASVLPPQTSLWNARYLSALPAPRDPVKAAAEAVQALNAAGADVVVMLGHTGLDEDGPGLTENFGRALAQIPGIDAMVLGHTHLRLPGPDHTGMTDVAPDAGRVAAVPTVMPGFAGACLGQIDLTLSRTGGAWRVEGAEACLLEASSAPRDDDAVARIVAPLHARARTHLAAEVGTAAAHLQSYFAALGAEPGQALCARAMRHAIAPALSEAGLDDLPLIAAAAPNAAGGRGGPDNYLAVGPGPILRRHLAAITPYPNEIWALQVSGADLRIWLERSAGFFATRGHAGPAPLVDWEQPVFNFDALFGLEAVYDPSRPRGARVVSVTHAGAPLRDDGAFALITTSYRAAGSGSFPGTGLDRVVAKAPGTLQDALEAVLARGPVSPPTASPFRLSGGGMRTLLDTAPQAANHLNEISEYAPEVVEGPDSGFLRIALTI